VVPVLPFALTERVGLEQKDVQKWTAVFLSIYGAALAIGSRMYSFLSSNCNQTQLIIAVFGWFADRSNSRRAPLLLGLLALGGSTAMLTAGRSLVLLLLGRFMQGISAAVVWTVGLALLSDTIEKENIGQAMGYIAAATSIGSLLGPLLGGVVYEAAGYYAVFYMGFAIIGLDIFLRLLMVEKSVANQWLSPAVESSGSQNSSDRDADVVQPSNVENAQIEEKNVPANTEDSTSKRWTERLPPLITLLRIPRLLVALLGCAVNSNSLGAFDSVLPLRVKEVFGWNSTGAGLIFVCLVVPALFGPVVGMISDKYGTRTLTSVGLFASVPVWVCLRFVTYNSIGQKVLLCALLAMLGLFMTMIMAPLMAEIDHCLTVEEKKKPGSLGKSGAAAQGYGLFNLAYAIGSLIGPIWAGFISEEAGWGTMTWTLGLLSGVAAVPVFYWTGGRIMLKGKERTVGAGESV
jgi:MFS family permease